VPIPWTPSRVPENRAGRGAEERPITKPVHCILPEMPLRKDMFWPATPLDQRPGLDIVLYLRYCIFDSCTEEAVGILGSRRKCSLPSPFSSMFTSGIRSYLTPSLSQFWRTLGPSGSCCFFLRVVITVNILLLAVRSNSGNTTRVAAWFPMLYLLLPEVALASRSV
jgi:hypothetical protein